MITSSITKEITLPHEEETTIVIRMLSHGALKKARDNRLRDLVQMVGGMDMSALQSMRREQSDDDEEADPMAGYDITTVLHKGIKSWSYDLPAKPENIDELDDVTAEYVAKEIINLSRRTVKQGEASSVV